MEGFCKDELKLFGPVQLYESAVVFAKRFKVLPEQIGPLLVGAGVAGVVFTDIVICVASAIVGKAQPSLEVSRQSTVSPLNRLLFV